MKLLTCDVLIWEHFWVDNLLHPDNILSYPINDNLEWIFKGSDDPINLFPGFMDPIAMEISDEAE